MTLLSKYIRNVRLKKASPYIRGDVLDLGCGGALVKDLFRDRIESYVGVERGGTALESVQANHPDARFHSRDLDTDPLKLRRKFDSILMIALIEHLFNQKHVFQEVVGHLRPQGRIVVTTPTVLGNDIVHRLGASVGLFAKSAVDDHIVIYNRKRFHILAKELGLSLERYCTFEFGCNQLAVLKHA